MPIRICPHEYEEELGAQLGSRRHTVTVRRRRDWDASGRVRSLSVQDRANSNGERHSGPLHDSTSGREHYSIELAHRCQVRLITRSITGPPDGYDIPTYLGFALNCAAI